MKINDKTEPKVERELKVGDVFRYGGINGEYRHVTNFRGNYFCIDLETGDSYREFSTLPELTNNYSTTMGFEIITDKVELTIK